MESILLRHISHLLMVLLSLTSASVVAQEQQQRPWGRVDNSVKSPDSSNSQSGYLGRYNPWANTQDKAGEGDAKQPRYRESQPRSDNRYRPESYTNPNARVYPPKPGYTTPSPYGYSMPNGTGYPGGPMEMAPWFGGINPNYGNYWNDPYESLSPDTGLMWSDMWRW